MNITNLFQDLSKTISSSDSLDENLKSAGTITLAVGILTFCGYQIALWVQRRRNAQEGLNPSEISGNISYKSTQNTSQSSRRMEKSEDSINGDDFKKIVLEDQFEDSVLVPVDTTVHVFEDFLEPNEHNPQDIRSHLEKMQSGLIVSTGTERSFFNLILSPEDRCTGLVIRDINPKVKAYTDFLIVLFKISNSRREFMELSNSNGSRLGVIEDKIRESSMTDKMKKYYIQNLEKFAKIYFSVRHTIGPNDNPIPVNYRKNDMLFEKIKRYADQGKIISTIGDIGDLEFLGDDVSVVDTSNIQDYSILNIRTSNNCNPRVVWNRYRGGYTLFYSYIQEKLTVEEKKEYDSLLNERYTGKHPINTEDLFYLHDVAAKCNFVPTLEKLSEDPYTYATPASYTKSSLNVLRFIDKVYVPHYLPYGK